MACGGLKAADRKIDSVFLNKHHSVRVADFALDIINVAQSIFLSGGDHLKVRIGIHTGHVYSVILGDVKPQFSLVGLSV